MATTPDPSRSSDSTGTGDNKPADRKPAKGGRFTPKAEKDPGVVRAGGAKPVGPTAAGSAGTGRYTPPTPKAVELTPTTKPWVLPLMFTAFALGLVLIVANYVGILPGAPTNWYLLGGIVSIAVGFLTATQLY